MSWMKKKQVLMGIELFALAMAVTQVAIYFGLIGEKFVFYWTLKKHWIQLLISELYWTFKHEIMV